jgi:hypothetical protein
MAFNANGYRPTGNRIGVIDMTSQAKPSQAKAAVLP